MSKIVNLQTKLPTESFTFSSSKILLNILKPKTIFSSQFKGCSRSAKKFPSVALS